MKNQLDRWLWFVGGAVWIFCMQTAGLAILGGRLYTCADVRNDENPICIAETSPTMWLHSNQALLLMLVCSIFGAGIIPAIVYRVTRSENWVAVPYMLIILAGLPGVALGRAWAKKYFIEFYWDNPGNEMAFVAWYIWGYLLASVAFALAGYRVAHPSEEAHAQSKNYGQRS